MRSGFLLDLSPKIFEFLLLQLHLRLMWWNFRFATSQGIQPYQMVKDHRTNQESGNVNAVMDGDLDPFIEAYLKQKMANASPK